MNVIAPEMPPDDTAHSDVPLLRFLTCGSVDDGKSTLIGRILFDTKRIFEDQLAAVALASRRFGTAGQEMDLALALDGLEAERQQGITIDVAYRFFATARRRFIVADTPGHVQYTRNMATGASTADLAIILVDARHGLLSQTRRHSFIVNLLGIRNVVLAVNKMDLVDFGEDRFREIERNYREFAAERFEFTGIQAIPLAARHGDNVTMRSGNLPWYAGPTLLDHLETVDVTPPAATAPFRMPVQWVNRPDPGFRGYAGTVATGIARPGDEVVILPSAQTTRIARIVTMDGDRQAAIAGSAVTLVLEDERDISRGDMIAAAASRPEVADQFAADLVWFDEAALIPGRPYLLKIGTRTVTVTVTDIKYRVDMESLEHLAAKSLSSNDVAVVNLSLSEPIAFEPYAVSRMMGGFILIDRISNATAGAGMIRFALRRAANIHWQAVTVDRASRAAIKAQTPAVLWLTGLSGSGKSTIANLVEKKLLARGAHTFLLDGDNVRHGLNRDLGFTEVDRVENIRRVAEVSKLFMEAGLIVIVSFISPYRSERQLARDLAGEGGFIEIFVDTPIEDCRKRDPKGLYAKADAGLLTNFTGVDAPYEAPEAPELHLRTALATPEEAAETVIEELHRRGFIPA
jgi:bifunctional enzyme CysN/CysC